jgi:hypothetical protein
MSIGGQVAVIAVMMGLGLLALIVALPSGNRLGQGHVHGGSLRTIIRHEARHHVAADRIGVRVTKVVLKADEGLVQLNRAQVDRMSHRDYLAFMMAGGAGNVNGPGCRGDRDAVREEITRMRRSGMNAAEIKRQVSAATADARRYGNDPKVSAYVKRWGG